MCFLPLHIPSTPSVTPSSFSLPSHSLLLPISYLTLSPSFPPPPLRQGVLTETTAELAASLTLAAARRVVEADYFMRAGKYEGWLPTMYVPPGRRLLHESPSSLMLQSSMPLVMHFWFLSRHCSMHPSTSHDIPRYSFDGEERENEEMLCELAALCSAHRCGQQCVSMPCVLR